MLAADVRTTVGPLELAVSLAVAAGETVAVLGPNGAGKTTLLRALAGLHRLDAGRIVVGDRVLADAVAGVHVPADERRAGVVFQEHRLFPHLTVRENVAFGPRAAGVPRRVALRDAETWLGRVGLADRAHDRPTRLSGGQAQRVALARALASDPALLLLDEPLAALDVDTRREVRQLLHTHLDGFAGPCVLVTHDPVEALTLADRLVIVEEGRVTQSGPPAEVTSHPRSRWIAELVGVNLLRGTADGTTVVLAGGERLRSATPAAGPVAVIVDPRAIAVHRSPAGGSPRNQFAGDVVDLDVRGDRVRVRVRVGAGARPGNGGRPDSGGRHGDAGGFDLVAEVTPDAVAALDLGAGGTVHLAVKATELQVHPDAS